MWNIYLKVGDTKIRPSRFKRMRPKSKWSQFFPVVNFWSKEFLLEFELPEDNLVKKDLELFMSGPKGQMNFEYKKIVFWHIPFFLLDYAYEISISCKQ